MHNLTGRQRGGPSPGALALWRDVKSRPVAGGRWPMAEGWVKAGAELRAGPGWAASWGWAAGWAMAAGWGWGKVAGWPRLRAAGWGWAGLRAGPGLWAGPGQARPGRGRELSAGWWLRAEGWGPRSGCGVGWVRSEEAV
ncbi:hypothetical protein Ahu01nite_009010 [Winogradskya humida]|uniref:Uncharacterized protein n=1 Tax=Winogradskya humida TaxID=113566 RepID=A0ABQ3ZGV0_9ACTN|nr:hypothetical protein Ahu01nite_009010 [Actinoplanes humidus]